MMITTLKNPKPVTNRLYLFKNSSGIFLLLVGLILLGTSCSDDTNEVPPRVVLMEATKVLTRTAGELKTFINASSIDLDANVLQYDVEIFKVKYKTKYKNSEVVASGLVVLPKTNDDVSMVSFQHGTIVEKEDAPTLSPINSTSLILYAALSSAGFITVIPDFIGFGESGNIFHPYYVEEATATAVIDNLKAAREWAREKKVNFNKQLFLAGYSQGGYATMATHKAIETTTIDGFDLIASFPASGGYDIKGMQEYMFAQDTYEEPYYMAYVALSYQSYYDWPFDRIGDFFQEPYASSIPALFNGVNSSGTINSQLNENVADLIKAEIISGIDSDPQYAYLVAAFNENSLLDWTPAIPMFMYHGNADITVPYQNSIDTYNQLISNGASSSIVTFTTLDGADHGSGVIPYIEDFIGKLLLLK